jgi:predicted phosphodiesterase
MKALAIITSPASIVMLVVFFLSGCGQSDNEHFNLDMSVGFAAADGASLTAAERLGHITAFANGSATIRLLSPSTGFTLETGSAGAPQWEITVQNMMPGSVCSAATPEEGSLAVLETIINATSSRFSMTVQPSRVVSIAIAPPDAAYAGAFRFALLSDIQGTDDRDIYAMINSDPSVRFLVSAGDLTSNGTGSQYREFMENISTLAVPYYSAPGNHDLFSDASKWHGYMGRFNSSFVFKNVRFTLLDSSGGTVEPHAYGWLASRLDEGKNANHIFITHYPPQDPFGLRGGSLSSNLEAAKLLALLGRGGVNLTLYGHIHTFYQFTNAGIPAYISGGGGGIQGILDPYGRHYLLIDADSSGIIAVTKVMVD